MTETVAPYDIARPIPQPSQAVASAAPALQSDAGPRATAIAGQQINEVAAEVDRYGLHLETLQAQDALNQLRAKKDDLTYGQGGFMQVKGGDVINPNRPGGPLLTDYSGRFQAVSDDLVKNLGPRARQMYNERAAGEMLGLKSDIAKHSLQQTELYGKSVFASGNAQDTSDAVRYSGDPGKVAEFATRARERATKYAQSEGLDPGFFAASAESNVVRAAIESRASQNDAAGALTLFKAFGSKLDAKDTIEVGRTMKTVQTGMDARGYVAWLDSTSIAPGSLPPLVDNYRGKIFDAAKAQGVDPFLMAGVVAQESKGDTRAVSPAGARGLTQLMPGTASDLGVSDPHNADQSIPGGTKYLKQQLDKYGNEELALMAYNWGPGNVDNWIKNGKDQSKVPAETRDYVQRVQGYKKAYATKWDPLAEGVNAAVPVPGASQTDASGVPIPGPPKADGPPGFLDTRQLTIDAEKWHLEATARNQRDNAERPDLLSAAKSLIDVQYETKKAQIELARNQLNKAVEDWVSKPTADGKAQTERPPPEIWNQLTYEKQRSIDATLAHNAKGTDGPTDQQTWYTIQRGLSSPDPNERAKWADVPLWQFKDKLSNTDFQELAKMQGTVRKGDPDKELTHVRGINQMTDDALLTMKIDPTPKPGSTDADKAAKFRRTIQDQLTAFEQQKGKKATPEEIQKIIDQQVRQIGGTSNWWSLGLGSDKRRFEMKIGDVPAPEQAKIVDALKRAGKPVTDDAIIDLYSRKAAKPAP